MLNISSLLSFHHFVDILESTQSSTILVIIILWCILISYTISDPSRKRRKFLRNLEKFPGPRAFPLIGNALHLLFPPDEIFSWLESVQRKWGDIVRIWVFGNPKLFVNSYDIAMQLLSRKTFLLKSEEFEPLRPVGGHSLAGAPPEIHPLRRKLLGPGFSRQAVEGSLELFCRHAGKLRDSLMILADNGVALSVLDYTGLCAYRIGCEMAFGHRGVQDISDTQCKEQMKAWHTMLVHLVNRSFQPWLKSDFIYYKTREGKQVQQCFEAINKFAETAIFKGQQQRWEYLKANQIYDHNEPDENAVATKPECYLDLLLDLQDKNELTKEQVLHELNIYIVAGYDTTGTTLAWILYLLATHPEIQDKCVEELEKIFEDDISTEEQGQLPSTSSYLSITVSHLKRIKYLEWCIKEALRLYPVLPWLLRRTDEDIQLSDGRVIPAGVDVPINTFLIHRNPQQFPDPEQFKPERYDVEGGQQGLLSFGAGPRICPGMLFAMHELKVVLSHLLLAFKWESEENADSNDNKQSAGKKKCLFHGVLVPANGINLKIVRRK